jgi:hypothetical protein
LQKAGQQLTEAATHPHQKMADLVEFCYGDSDTTWGGKRHALGHPEPYAIKFFELGNEQYNYNYADQVAAMEKRASELGMGKTLFYMNPHNGQWLTVGGGVTAFLFRSRSGWCPAPFCATFTAYPISCSGPLPRCLFVSFSFHLPTLLLCCTLFWRPNLSTSPSSRRTRPRWRRWASRTTP